MPKLEKQGKYYTFRYYHPETKQRLRENTIEEDRQKAKVYMEDFLYKLRHSQKKTAEGIYNIETLLWKDFCSLFMKWSEHEKSAPEADRRVINIINKYYPDMIYFKDFNRDKIREYLDRRKEEKCEDNTVNRDLHSIKSMWSFAVNPQELNLNCRNEAKGISEIPVELVKKSKYFTLTQKRIIETKIESSRIQILCWLMLHLGLRLKEAVNVRWNDIDFIIKVAKIYPFKTKKKSPSPVQVPMDDELINFLSNLKHTSDFVCGGDYRDKKARGSLSRVIKKRFEELGIGGTAHTCRHTFISHAIMNGVKDNLIMRWARLKKVEMLQVYGHLSPDFENETINKVYEDNKNLNKITIEDVNNKINELMKIKNEMENRTKMGQSSYKKQS